MHRIHWLRKLGALALTLLCFWVRPAQADSTFDQVRQRGELVIGSDATYPPFELKTDDGFEGFDIDLGTEIGKELGVKTRFINQGWDGIFAGLQAKKYDLVISDVVITAERKKSMAFSRPYFLSGQTIVRRKGDDSIKTSKNLPGKMVAVQQETTGQYAVEKLGLKSESIRKFETMQDALLEVRNKKADAAVGDLPALASMVAKGYPELELVGGNFTDENYSVVTRLDEPELLQAVNEALTKIMADGRFAKIYSRWIGGSLPANYITRLDKVQGQGTTVKETLSGSALTIRWNLLGPALPLLLKGARMTLEITFLALLFGIPLGLVVALARMSSVKPLSYLAATFIEIFRGTPLLLQVFTFYFVLPSLGIPLNQLTAAVVALSLNSGAYIAEIFRAGIQSIDVGQTEASRALGLSSAQTLRWVILPQTGRRVLPPLTNETVAMLKDSSLISVIGLEELMRVGREQASNSGSPVTFYLALGVIYLLMTLPLTYLARRLEARWEPISRPRIRKGVAA